MEKDRCGAGGGRGGSWSMPLDALSYLRHVHRRASVSEYGEVESLAGMHLTRPSTLSTDNLHVFHMLMAVN